MADNHSVQSHGNRRKHHEGPRNHYIAFIMSLVLTLLAFATVMADFGRTFTIMFILVLGIVQVIFQLAFWMHMKDRGHFYATIGLITGLVIALTALAAVVYWLWW